MYCQPRGERPGSMKSFGDRLRSRGLVPEKRTQHGRQVRGWRGIQLRQPIGLPFATPQDGSDGLSG